jgi:hypothetical protein
MLKYRHIVRSSAAIAADAANRAFESYRDERVKHEPGVTDRMLGAIEEALNGKVVKDVRWTAATLKPASGQGAEELRHGADFIGALHFGLADYTVKKGFLAQAKLAEPGLRFSTRGWKHLQSQCQKMLELTPDSFVFCYSKTNGIRVIPAISVLGAATLELLSLYNHGISRFFEDHFSSFIGDAALGIPNVAVLDELRKRYDAERALYLGARGAAT